MIDENKLIEVLKDEMLRMEFDERDESYNFGIDTAIFRVQTQPKVGEWIPVEDEFPKSRKSVLIYSKEGGVAEGEYDEQKGYFVQYRWNAKDIHVIAWRPLPDPYEVKGNE